MALELLGGGGAGVAVTRKLIGPVAVNIDTPDLITDPGADLGITLPAGMIIEAAWLEADVIWDLDALGQTQYISINVVPSSDLNSYLGLVFYQFSDGPNSQRWATSIGGGAIRGEFLNPNGTTSTVNRSALPVRLTVDLEVRVAAYGADPQAGASNLFVLYSEPA